MASTTPELPTFDFSPSTLLDIAMDLVNQVQTATNDLTNRISPQNATFENALRPLADIDNEVKGKVQYLALFQAVSPSSEMRKASSAAVNMVDKAYWGVFRMPSLFDLVDAVHKDQAEEDPKGEDQKLLKRFHSMFMENGLELQGDKRDRFIGISNRLIELRVAFMENLSSDPGYVWKDQHELEGIAAETLQELPMHPSTSQRGIKLKKPNITMVLTRCHIAETRKDVFLQSQNIFPDNLEIFNEAVTLRDESARLLGFSSYAAQKSRHKMITSPRNVDQLLDELYNHLQPLAQKELETLQHLKGGDGEGYNSSTSLSLWDFDYYHDRLLREKYNTNHELIAEYFPAEITIQQMLKTFETIFSLSIAPVEVAKEQVWHSDVRVYSVRDDKSAFLGFLYLDIYPREGKYNHAANFNIYPVRV
ncbi:Neurolysin/Thimet oligopeptidase, N-terminal [Penicillium expansum]|uniref:Neurolysin/Thimet oligopeptidase, N-terminal n=1 Tax=Penicillium expansum TaxID=27334 RepID=A0A0A2JDY8_PENEN|nr:Neurolysin/Thimet oligopeptidase, N-terminal [Penicillium expansum]KGO53574.1 Neurolysin/Thimet oligopeptidase, N-terminal [Penicillium expansum]